MHMYVCMCVCVFVCAHAHVFVCMCKYACTHVCVHVKLCVIKLCVHVKPCVIEYHNLYRFHVRVLFCVQPTRSVWVWQLCHRHKERDGRCGGSHSQRGHHHHRFVHTPFFLSMLHPSKLCPRSQIGCHIWQSTGYCLMATYFCTNSPLFSSSFRTKINETNMIFLSMN